MALNVKNNDLEFLGEDFQVALIKCFIEDPKFFISIQAVVDQNMFTRDELRRIVGFMKDRFSESEKVASYFEIETLIRTRVNDSTSVESLLAFLESIKNANLEGMDLVEDSSEKFFKQQNLIKALNKAGEIIKRGDFREYYSIEDIVKKAIETNTKNDESWTLFENVDSDLSEDWRGTIPTGVPEFDRSLHGGIGRRELGLIVAPMGVGKAQPLTSHVLTPSGFKLMADIKVGDQVIGLDGKPHPVIGIYPQGRRHIYRIKFSDGSTCRCDKDHLWNVYRHGNKEMEVCTLSEIMQNFEEKAHQYRIPLCQPIEFHKNGFEEDEEKITTLLELYSDIQQKYIYGGVEQRIELFQDLMDAHGCIEQNDDGYGELKFFTESKTLALQVQFIVRSLGGSCILEEKHSSYNKQSNGYTSYCVFITLTDNILPFSSAYKLEKYRSCKKHPNEIWIDEISYDGTENAQCIMVDSEDHTYITDNFIVTHNTSICTGFAAGAATTKTERNDYRGYKVLHYYNEDDDISIRRKYYGYLLNIDACDLSRPEIRPNAVYRLKTELTEEHEMLRNNIRGERLNTGEVTASQIKQKIKKSISNGFKPDLVIIDYFECLRAERASTIGESEWSLEAITMRKLENMAKDLDIAIWLPTQGTKGSIGIEHLTMQHAGGSVAKTQIGHIVITLSRTSEMAERDEITLSIEKFRAAKISRSKFECIKFNNGTCRFDFSSDRMNYESVEQIYDEDARSLANRLIANRKGTS